MIESKCADGLRILITKYQVNSVPEMLVQKHERPILFSRAILASRPTPGVVSASVPTLYERPQFAVLSRTSINVKRYIPSLHGYFKLCQVLLQKITADFVGYNKLVYA